MDLRFVFLIFSFVFGLMDLGYVFSAMFFARIYLAMFFSIFFGTFFSLNPKNKTKNNKLKAQNT
jgi:hypothetical protein